MKLTIYRESDFATSKNPSSIKILNLSTSLAIYDALAEVYREIRELSQDCRVWMNNIPSNLPDQSHQFLQSHQNIRKLTSEF